MLTEPGNLAVTKPDADTLATVGSLLSHVTVAVSRPAGVESVIVRGTGKTWFAGKITSGCSGDVTSMHAMASRTRDVTSVGAARRDMVIVSRPGRRPTSRAAAS